MTSTRQPSAGVTAPMELEDAESPAQVLAFARAERAASLRADARVMAAAVAWADQHPAESLGVRAACSSYRDGEIPIAGQGAPLVAEFCIPEFAAALGMSTDAGKRLIGQALELAYRLPKHWARVVSGDLPAWRARRLAEQTMGLSPVAAGFVDTQLAAYLHKTSFAAQERLINEAKARFDPAQAQAEAEKAEDRRHVNLNPDQIGFWGTTQLDGEIDLADGLDLEAAIQAGAEYLKNLGSTEPLDVRRAQALGMLARGELHQLLDTEPAAPADPAAPAETEQPEQLETADPGDTVEPEPAVPAEPGEPAQTRDTEPEPEQQPQPRSRRQRARPVVLYLHLSEAALHANRSGSCDLARVQNTRTMVTAAQVRQWCGSVVGGPVVQITVKPVIDLDEHIHVGAYEVPDRLSEQTQLRDHHCVFPWCTRPATRCDDEHAVPHNRGGPTCSCNIAPLCRRHHRLKTHAAWSYIPLEPGTHVWTSPHGYQYLVDHTGTTDVTPAERRGRPLPPHAQQP